MSFASFRLGRLAPFVVPAALALGLGFGCSPEVTPADEDGAGGSHFYAPWWLYKEAAKLGFRRVILPKNNLRGATANGCELVGVDRIDDAIRALLG